LNIDIRENYIKDIHDENDNVFISKALKSEESFNDTRVNSISSNVKTSNNTGSENEKDSKLILLKDSNENNPQNKKTEELLVLKKIENVIDLNFILSDGNKNEENKKNLEKLKEVKEENLELGKLNEILEREINLLKSLILINNLNSTNNNERENDQRQYYNKNYFIEMCNDNNLQELVQDDGLFKKHKTLHMLMIKIKVFNYLFS